MGIGDRIQEARAESVEKAANESGANVEFDVVNPFDLIDFDEIAKEVEQAKEEEDLRRLELAEACKVSVALASAIAPVEHFFHAGDQKFVGVVKSHPDSEAMKIHSRNIKRAQVHFEDASCEEFGEGKFRIGKTKPHCVIAARLAGLVALVSRLTQPRKANNGDDLRPLWMNEICDIAANIGAVVETKGPPKGPHFKKDGKFYVIGKNGDVTPEQNEEFQIIVGKILLAGKKADSKARADCKKSLREQVTVSTLEKALENDGIYLANVPPWKGQIAGEEKSFPGGELLLQFSRPQIAIGGEDPDSFVQGTSGFVEFVSGLKKENAVICFEDVTDLLEEDREKPDGRRGKADFLFWTLVRRHILWLADCADERALIHKMRHDSDLDDESFLRDGLGHAVLELDSFSRSGEDASSALPAAIRVARLMVGDQKAIKVLEVSPKLLETMGCWIGKDKPLPEDNLPGEFGRFINTWKAAQSNS